MDWIRTNTDADATVLVGSEVGEWIPPIADRPIAVTRWGFEWLPQDTRRYHLDTYRAAQRCEAPSCYATVIDRMQTRPTYLVASPDGMAVDAFNNSDRFVHVFSSIDIRVYRVRPGE